MERRSSSTHTEAGAHATNALGRGRARDARRRTGRARLDVAGRRSGPPPVLARLGSVRRRAAPRRRHRRRSRNRGPRAGGRGRRLRRLVAAGRTRRHDPDGRRLLGHAAPARGDARRARGGGRGGRRRRPERPERRPGERRASRPSGRQGLRRARGVCRPARAAAGPAAAGSSSVDGALEPGRGGTLRRDRGRAGAGRAGGGAARGGAGCRSRGVERGTGRSRARSVSGHRADRLGHTGDRTVAPRAARRSGRHRLQRGRLHRHRGRASPTGRAAPAGTGAARRGGAAAGRAEAGSARRGDDPAAEPGHGGRGSARAGSRARLPSAPRSSPSAGAAVRSRHPRRPCRGDRDRGPCPRHDRADTGGRRGAAGAGAARLGGPAGRPRARARTGAPPGHPQACAYHPW